MPDGREGGERPSGQEGVHRLLLGFQPFLTTDAGVAVGLLLCLQVGCGATYVTAAFAAYERQMRGYVSEHQQAGRAGAERFFMGTPTQEMLDMIAANAPEVSRAQTIRLKEYPTSARVGSSSSGLTAG
ncbi:hypothetical protein WEB32_03935 [Streptomyces netropsis]|uniref:hypothetical protein n=1 Tax=Streptomyces netropsis TaxID=55404 RepID=UPI0030D01A09